MTLVGLVLTALALPATVLATMLTVARAVLLHRRVDPLVDAAWLTGRPYHDKAGVEVMARYLWRVRSHRINGAVVGAGIALLEGLTEHRRVSIGIGGPGWSPMGDVLFGGLGGLLVGSVLAETWRIRIGGAVRHAELEARAPDVKATSLRPVVACLTAATVALGLASGELRGFALAAASSALLVVHQLVLRAVAERGRPALPPELRLADDTIRRFASRRLTVETLAAAVLLAGWQFGGVPRPISDWIVAGISLASLVGTVVLLRRSRPWPPWRLRRVSAAAPRLAT